MGLGDWIELVSLLNACNALNLSSFSYNKGIIKIQRQRTLETMAFRIASLFELFFLSQLSIAQRPPLKLTICKPRALIAVFKANKTPRIRLYKACTHKRGASNCGGPVTDVIFAWCTRKVCPPGVRCKRCFFRVRPHQVPRYYHNQDGPSPKLGHYRIEIFGPEFCYGPPFEFSSDFGESGEDWFRRNDFSAGCKDRVNCYSFRRSCKIYNAPYDLALYAQGCTSTLVHKDSRLTALSVRQCFKGNVVDGIPVNEAIGTGCAADTRIIWASAIVNGDRFSNCFMQSLLFYLASLTEINFIGASS